MQVCVCARAHESAVCVCEGWKVLGLVKILVQEMKGTMRYMHWSDSNHYKLARTFQYEIKPKISHWETF